MSNPTTDNNELMIDLMEELTLIELIQHIVNLAEGCALLAGVCRTGQTIRGAHGST